MKRKAAAKPSLTAAKDLIRSCFKTVERWYEKKERVTGVETGYAKLDEMTLGLQPSDLIVIAGRPSMGKTALALGIARHLGIKKRGTVAIFSPEMSKEILMFRLLCSEARVDCHKMRSGYLGRADWPKLTAAAGRIGGARVFIDDTPAISVLEMRAKARRLKAEHGLDLVIVDCLQFVRGCGNADNPEQEISDLSLSLKALAKDLQVPVVAVSQLSRAVETRADKRPILADLRKPGAIEQIADLVLFIHRDEIYQSTDENRGIADIIIGKQRNGPIGTVQLAFLDRYLQFENLGGDMPV